MKPYVPDPNDFAQWFIDQVPVFDEMLMDSIRPTDGWLNPSPLDKKRYYRLRWRKTLESVRKLSEGPAYKLTVKP